MLPSELISPFGTGSLDIDTIRTSFKDLLVANSVISEVNYLGSNISILIDIMAYGIQSVNMDHALTANEVMLLTSTIEQNIITLGKQLGYNITRPISSKMSVRLSYTIPEGYTISIPAFSNWTCGTYNFLNTDDILLTHTNNTKDITLVEGEYIDWVKDTDLEIAPSVESTSFMLGYKNIENDHVYMYVKRAADTVWSEAWTKVSSLLNLRKDSPYYYETYDVDTKWVQAFSFFGNLGNSFVLGDTIRFSFIISNGSLANGISSCVPAFDIYVGTTKVTDFTPVVLSASTGGQSMESISSIQANAPLFFNTGNREVNEMDYKAFLIKSSLVSTATAWGGELMTPEKLGYVYLSMIPQDTSVSILPPADEASVLSMLAENRIISTKRIIWYPAYFSVDFDVTILGNLSNVLTRQSQITNVITSYFNTKLSDFNSYVYEGKITKEIEAVFSNDAFASSKVLLKPKMIWTANLFSQNVNDSNKVVIFIPNSAKRYYLEKAGVQIPVPENNVDLVSYMENGWVKVYDVNEDIDISFSATIAGHLLTTGSEYTTLGVRYKDVTHNGITIGVFNVSESTLYMDPTFASIFGTSVSIDMTYSPSFNIKAVYNSYIKLGTITYV